MTLRRRPYEVLRADVVVVGAGLSGLVAARSLARRGASVVVLEARHRVGGKTFTPLLDGVPVDLGAHWVGAGHARVIELADELGLTREPQRLDGRHVTMIGGHRRERRFETPLVPLHETLETGWRISQLELMRRRVQADAPWTAPNAAALDAITVERWMRRLHSDSARATFRISIRTMLGVEPSEVSVLALLWLARAGGGLPNLMRFRGGAQDAHLVGGTEQLAGRLAADLGDAVITDAPVRSITHGRSGVWVTADGVDVRAGAAIVAASPTIAAQIRFTPHLPPARTALTRNMRMGSYFKAMLGYDHAWWREEGLSGVGLSDEGAVQMVVDVGPSDGPGILAAFVTGAPARGLAGQDEAARRAIVTEATAAILGPRARRVAAYRDLDWGQEPWSGGAPMAVPGPAALTGFGHALRAPTGPIYWAGTEAALSAPGYMEGAIDAGERAAAAVFAEDRAPAALLDG